MPVTSPFARAPRDAAPYDERDALGSHEASAVRFDAAAPRLAELFAPLFALLIQLRSTDAYGDPERLRERITDLLDEADASARAAGVPPEDTRDALFAIVAFLDEAILSSDWPDRHAWLSRPMQLQRYDRYDAGEAFFDRLGEIRRQPHRAEVLEVYYHCLALGFKGQYQLQGQDALRREVAEAQAALARAPGHAPGPIAPRGTPRETVGTAARASVPPWMLAAGAAALALVIYLAVSLYVTYAASGVARTIEALAP